MAYDSYAILTLSPVSQAEWQAVRLTAWIHSARPIAGGLIRSSSPGRRLVAPLECCNHLCMLLDVAQDDIELLPDTRIEKDLCFCWIHNQHFQVCRGRCTSKGFTLHTIEVYIGRLT